MQQKNIKSAICLTGVIYAVLTALFLWFLFQNDLIVPIAGLNRKNLPRKFFADMLLSLPIVLLLLASKFVFRYTRNDLGITGKHPVFLLLLCALYIAEILIKPWDRAINFYIGFFYLIPVAFSEDLLCRGFLYGQLKKYGRMYAVIYSGAICGILHTFVPLFMNGLNAATVFNIFSAVMSFILISFLYAYLYDKCQSLLIFTLVHALLDNF